MSKKKKEKDTLRQGFVRERDLIKELTESSMRSKVIVGSAALELLLTRLLEKYLIDGSSFFESDGILFSFGQKIKIAFSLGLISKKLLEDLNIVKNIRNIFAHNMFNCDFSNPQVLNACKKLSYIRKTLNPDEHHTSQESIFVLAIGVLYVALIKKIVRIEKAKECPGELNNLAFEQIDYDYLDQ